MMTPREPYITVNGRALSEAEAMSVRVAVSTTRMQMNDPEYAKGLGESLAQGYDRHLAAVEQMMIQPR